MKPIDLKNPIHFIAFGFGSGLLTPAPGTWGSLVGVILSIILWTIAQSSLFFIFLTLVSFIAGCYICTTASQDLNIHDDGRIVWDEITAIFLMFAYLPEYNLLSYVLAFISFRIFDIIKPFPIRYFDEKLKGGLGIMLDDILAAIFALASLYILYYFISLC